MKRSAFLKDMVDGVRQDIQEMRDLDTHLENKIPAKRKPHSATIAEPEIVELGTAVINHGLTGFAPESLGNLEFKKRYGIKYAYLTGSMVRGIASKEMVVKMGRAQMMGFLGTGGMDLGSIEDSIKWIQQELAHGEAYGFNLLHTPGNPRREEEIVDLYLKYDIRTIEASAFMQMSPALIRFHAKGMQRDSQGQIIQRHHIVAKISRPEIAEGFLSPASDKILEQLVLAAKITQEEAEISRTIAVADDICVEADSGGHTDGGVAFALLPTIRRLRDELQAKYGYRKTVSVGLAGGIGTPEAAASAFMLGADFIMTGSINQCTVEAGISDSAKDLLQQANVQDTDYAPAGDMFELGAKVQVLKKSTFFPARANKLYDLYRFHNSIDEIDAATKKQVEEKYFKRSFNHIYDECKSYFASLGTNEIERAEKNPKFKMALIFRWYFHYTNMLAIKGDEDNKIDYQVHCSPAMGAFNQWVKGSPLEAWQDRQVDAIALKILKETTQIIYRHYQALLANQPKV